LGGFNNACCLRFLRFWLASFFNLAAFCAVVTAFRFGFALAFDFAFDFAFTLDLVLLAGFLAADFLRVVLFLAGAFFGTPAAASLRAAAGFRFDAATRPVWAFGFPGFVA
jgi:hypothetical protein